MKLITSALTALLLLTVPQFVRPSWGWLDCSFKGKVVDADTKEPIEGAVVVAVWHEAMATIAGESTRLHDVKETLTDRNGEWMIKGPRGRWGGNITALWTFLTGSHYTRPPQFIVFKPGYCSWPNGFGIDGCRGRMKPSGNHKVADGETVELPRLTEKKERLRNLPGDIWGDSKYTPKEAQQRQKEFIRLINEESRNLGIGEIQFLTY